MIYSNHLQGATEDANNRPRTEPAGTPPHALAAPALALSLSEASLMLVMCHDQ